ncbi:twin-arginine translocation signal domain-containing protein [Defluviimonas sp. WL0002]|uniref:Twin-arginine translocation signal domain-containing protein n=1 Tax=Albidovulum marisflavi TaxID=2984159 RepID=A0ABT2ZDY0_9RHOB|nr:twin-arginine translocation signal domain-containing protein [Defluviimonas sp. WL0002]MCV2869227.1 twin-arginine translocation signal domain-containing protein [Defluviimonas sp. WL0002]
MGNTSKTEGTNRRGFLKLATTAAPAAVAASVMTGTEAEASETAKSGGLQDTAHTRAYYDSARF